MKRRLKNNEFIVFDGAMGTMLQLNGMKSGELPESYNILYPDIISKIHREYIAAGADIITANTFGANRYKYANCEYSLKDIISKGIEIARDAAGDKLVALDVGPLGMLMQPYGLLSFEEAYEVFKEQVIAGASAGADVILIETMSDIYEAKAAILAAKENSCLPVICTMTFQADKRTLTGTDPLSMVNMLQGLGVDALGVNCSLGPKELLPITEELLRYSKIPVIVQPNAGLPRVHGDITVFDISAKEYGEYVREMAEKGVTIFGGCCGTTPEHIKAVRDVIQNMNPRYRQIETFTAVSSGNNTVIISDAVKIIGERINPTGKKKFKEALKSNDMEYILNEAIRQRDAGAHILDVNVGLPEIDEKEMMINVVKELQSIIDLPLQIDSASSDVIEAAVRVCRGKALVNSVNGKDEVMDSIFPIVKKYGCCVVGLTIDEQGIPEKAEDRFKIAKKIIQKAEEYKIPKEDIFIDCLVLTASAQQKEVKETIKAVALVKEKLGVKTILGVSNVSFGLPQRELLNRTFLAAALAVGLDAAIINPLSEDMMQTIAAFNVLWDTDHDAKEYIKQYSGSVVKSEQNCINMQKDIKKLIMDGMKEEVSRTAKQLLNSMTGMEIINNYLIPALDEVGQKFEKGIIFLPQLIQTAETVKRAFEVIKDDLEQSGKVKSSIYKGKILLATVKGDIHDIGKNIVKILLQNYGFEVIDLGKDVSAEIIVKTVKNENIKLVGLSALMTTTVKSMEDTIKALKDNKLDCKVMVGGAVLNEAYSKMINADYYAKDAREAVKIANKVFENIWARM